MDTVWGLPSSCLIHNNNMRVPSVCCGDGVRELCFFMFVFPLMLVFVSFPLLLTDRLYAAILEKVPFPIITRDMIARLQTPCVASQGSLGLEVCSLVLICSFFAAKCLDGEEAHPLFLFARPQDLSLTPTDLHKAVYFLRRYRKGGGSSDINMQT